MRRTNQMNYYFYYYDLDLYQFEYIPVFIIHNVNGQRRLHKIRFFGFVNGSIDAVQLPYRKF